MGNHQSTSNGGSQSSPGQSSPVRQSSPGGSALETGGSGSANPSGAAGRPLAGGVSSLFGGNRDRSGSMTSSLGRVKSNSMSTPPSPPTPPGLVDGGHLHPQGLYALRPAAQDYSHFVVKGLILEKKLAPFYRGLEDYEEGATDEEVIAALRGLRANQAAQMDELQNERDGASTTSPTSTTQSATETFKKGIKIAVHGNSRQDKGSSSSTPTHIDRDRREAQAYQGATECPICFLYYPPNTNTSRCCEQPLCTECFVQMKRAEATITHLESEPAACPFCMEPDFGVIYEVQKIVRPDTLLATSPSSSDNVLDPRPDGETLRRKSVSSKSKQVVTIDQIRPDWEEKLNAVKSQAARRASRRIIMHRVGDRLIPVGYTSSRSSSTGGADTGPITTEMSQEAFAQLMAGGRGMRSGSGSGAAAMGGSGGRRSSNRRGPEGVADLEELMIMEAMRLSMVDQEEQRKKEAEADAEAKRKQETERLAQGASMSNLQGASSGSSSDFTPSPPQNLATPTSTAPLPQTISAISNYPNQPAESSPLSGTPVTQSEFLPPQPKTSAEPLPSHTATGPAATSAILSPPIPTSTSTSSISPSAALPTANRSTAEHKSQPSVGAVLPDSLTPVTDTRHKASDSGKFKIK